MSGATEIARGSAAGCFARAALVLTALVSMFGASTARAQVASRERAELTVARGAGAEDCPDETTIATSVATRLGYDPFERGAARRVHVRIERLAGVLRARIELITGDEAHPLSRSIESSDEDCRELASAIVLAVSIAIDPLATPAAAETQEGSAPESAAEDVVLTPVPAAVTPVAAPFVSGPASSEYAPSPDSDTFGPNAHARIGLGASFVAGTGPTVTGGLALAVGVEWDALVVDGEARIELPTSGASAVGTFESMLISFALAPCGRVAPVLFCGVIRGGPLRVSGRAVEDASDVTSLWIGLGARLGFEAVLDPHVRLQANAELLAALSQTNVLIGVERIWRTEPVALSLTAGIVLGADRMRRPEVA
jgi:hypothetical protein